MGLREIRIFLAAAVVFVNLFTAYQPALTHPVIQIKKNLLTTSSKQPFPIARELDKYISIFSSHKCLIVVDNSHHAKFEFQPKTPVMLTGSTFLSSELLGVSSSNSRIVGPERLAPQNITTSTDGNFKCPISDYYEGCTNYESCWLCMRLNYTLYNMNTKGYSCKIYVSRLTNLHTFPQIAYRKRSSLNEIFSVVSTPTINVILDEHSNQTDDGTNCIALYLQSVLGINERCAEVFLVFLISEHHSVALVVQRQGNIASLHLLRLCPPMHRKWKAALNPLRLESDLLKNLRQLQDLSSASSFSPMTWLFEKTAARDSVPGYMERLLESCGGTNYRHNSVARIGQGYAQTWMSVMKNYSISTRNSYICDNGERLYFQTSYIKPDIEFRFFPNLRNQQSYPYFHTEDHGDLRFLACGRRGISALPWHEFVNVFDVWIWMAILYVIVAATGFLHFVIGSDVPVVQFGLSVLKIIVEQSDSVVESVKVRGGLASFILMGLVLSNAYKNSNVYNMISPRTPVPYLYTRELLADKFSLYTRLGLLESRSGYITHLINELDAIGGDYEIVKQNGPYSDHYLLGISEVAAAAQQIYNLFKIPLLSQLPIKNMQEGHNPSKLVSTGVLKNSQMSDVVKQSMQNLVRNPYWLHETDEDRRFTLLDKLKEVQAAEAEELFKLIRNCSKVALILPEHLCHENSKRLSKEARLPYTYVGKEGLSEIGWMFSLHGVGKITSQFLTRLKSAHESGHWHKWTRLFGSSTDVTVTIKANSRVVAARMDGNVILIFIVWMCGLSLALFRLIFETAFTNLLAAKITGDCPQKEGNR